MNLFYSQTLPLLALTILVVFGQSWLQWPWQWTGAQIDLIPGLVVAVAMHTGFWTWAAVAFLAGLWNDSLSLNPLGLSCFPLFLAGMITFLHREDLLGDKVGTQVFMGATATAGVPLLQVFMLCSLGSAPLIGMASLWQWLVMVVLGAAATPFFVRVTRRFDQALRFPNAPEMAQRANRQIKRWRT